MEQPALEPEVLAKLLRTTAFNAYRCTLVGNAPRLLTNMFDRMTKPVVGDWVVEISTIHYTDRPHLDAVGVLEKMEREPVTWADPDWGWNEAVEGRPHPTEPVYYLRTLSGYQYRWTNAQIIAILPDLVDAYR